MSDRTKTKNDVIGVRPPSGSASRRGFAKAVAGGTLIAGWSALLGTWVARAEDTGTTPFDAAPALDGELLSDDTTRQDYAQDYGQIVHERPLAVLRPGSVEDIARMIRFARRRGISIAARGHGHQPFGQAQVRGGLVIDLRSLRSVHALSADRIEVGAGADWRSVVRAAQPAGRTPPVLPAYLGLTVGGTLSIGGIGIASFRYGAQIDQVVQLQVVTGEGEVVTCSDRKHPDLFHAVLAGQGQCAIITRAQLRLTANRPMVREYMLRCDDLTTMLQDEETLLREDRCDGVVGFIAPAGERWSFALSAIREFTPPDAPKDAQLTRGLRSATESVVTRDLEYVQYVDAIEDMPFVEAHADLGLLLPGSEAAAFISDMLPRLREDELGLAARMRVFVWKREPFTRPLFRAPEHDTFVYVAMLRAETTDSNTVSRLLAGNRTLFESARQRGGTLYPYSALELTRGDWRRHYGERWGGLVEAKRRFDPDNVFASGPDLFR